MRKQMRGRYDLQKLHSSRREDTREVLDNR